MEIHRQRCQNCGSLDVHNILVRRQGDPVSVFVRCSGCGELVARYRLRDYYHHGKGAESFFHSIGSDAGDSGRASLDAFRRAQEESLEGYREALETLQNMGKDV